MTAQTIHLNGKSYVILELEEFERLTSWAQAGELPPLPAADADGNYPAIEYARASIARDIIRERTQAGWTQRELARLAGIRVETLCRIETGKHTPSVATIERIERALKKSTATKRKKQP